MTVVTQRPAPAPASRRAGTRWYWVSGAVAATAVLAAAVWMCVGIVSMTRHVADFPRTRVPGSVTFAVAEPATRYVYFEGDANPALDDLDVRLAGPDGRRVDVRAYDLHVRYDALGRRGRTVGTFEATAPGEYRLVVGSGPRGGYVAVGDSFARRTLSPLAGAGLVALTGILAAASLAAWAGTRRPGRASGGSWAAGSRQ